MVACLHTRCGRVFSEGDGMLGKDCEDSRESLQEWCCEDEPLVIASVKLFCDRFRIFVFRFNSGILFHVFGSICNTIL